MRQIKARPRASVKDGSMSATPTAVSQDRVIVIVEDDVSLVGALTFALEADGFKVCSFTSARPLLEAPIGGDCMVVDLRLPDLDGLSLIAELRARGVTTPAILMTTNPGERCRAAAASARVAIVEKPLIGGDLRRRIDEAIARA